MMCYQSLTVALVATLFTAIANADEPKKDPQITILKEELLQKKDWKNAGFGSPQATAQTFLWATREGHVETVLKCFDKNKQLNLSDDDKVRMKKAASAATGFQPLAIRTIGTGRVELKFNVEGWQDKPFVHQFKLIGKEWKIDSASSTATAEW